MPKLFICGSTRGWQHIRGQHDRGCSTDKEVQNRRGWQHRQRGRQTEGGKNRQRVAAQTEGGSTDRGWQNRQRVAAQTEGADRQRVAAQTEDGGTDRGGSIDRGWQHRQRVAQRCSTKRWIS